MDQNVSTFSAGLKYGLIGGVTLVIIGLIMYLTGATDYSTGKQDPISQILSFLVLVLSVVLAIKFFKSNNHEALSFGEGMGTSFYTGLFLGLVQGVWVYVFFNFIDPGVLEIIQEATKEQTLATGRMSEEEYEQAEGMMNAFTSPGVMSIMTIIMTVIFSLIIGVVSSLVMKEEANPLA